MTISDKIKGRLLAQNKPFNVNDNIADCIKDGELEELINELTERFEGVLSSLVIDYYHDPNSRETPRRLAKMYVEELFEGRYTKRPKVTSFPNEGETKYTGMLVVRAEITSVCAHHHQPVKGVCYVGIIPNNRVIGLSKYIRVAQWCARRGTLQESLCNDICNNLKDITESNDIGVYVAATHGCVENRGVGAHSSLTQTTVLSGEFEHPDVKKEFFDNIALQENHG